MPSYTLRLPTLEDIEPILLSEKGEDEDRVLLAISYYEQEGGYAADGTVLVAMARTPEDLLDRMLPHLRIQKEPSSDYPGQTAVRVLKEPSLDGYLGTVHVQYGKWPFQDDASSGAGFKVIDCALEDIAALNLAKPSELSGISAAPARRP